LPPSRKLRNLGMPDSLFSYIVSHSREPEGLKALREETQRLYPRCPTMAVGPDQGAFLEWLVEALGVDKAVEVGVFTGYSSVCIGLGVKKRGGRLYALDRDAVAMGVAEKYWGRFGLGETVVGVCGEGMAGLEEVEAREGAGSVDFAFVDADKKGYMGYYERLLGLVRVGGVIVFDNVLWYGAVAEEGVGGGVTESLRELSRFVVGDERVSACMLGVGDGMLMCTKR